MVKVGPFDNYTNRYEEWFERNRFAYDSELLAVKTLLPETGTGIEIGVGSGRFAEPFDIKAGIDPSRKMRELAQKRGIETINGVAENLPFDYSSFDFALMVTTICFLDDVKMALEEAYRIIKPGGAMIIGFIDKVSPLGKFYQERKNQSVFYNAATFYSVDEVISYLRKAGFMDFSFTQTIFHDLSEIKSVEPIKEGYGEGSFVVVRGDKVEP